MPDKITKIIIIALIFWLMFIGGCGYHLIKDSDVQSFCEKRWPAVDSIEDATARAALIEKKMASKWKFYALLTTIGLGIATIVLPQFKTISGMLALASGTLYSWLYINNAFPKTSNAIILGLFILLAGLIFKALWEVVDSFELMKIYKHHLNMGQDWKAVEGSIDKTQSWPTYIVTWVIRKIKGLKN